MRRFLYQDFISIVETIIDNIEKALGLGPLFKAQLTEIKSIGCASFLFKIFTVRSIRSLIREWFLNSLKYMKSQFKFIEENKNHSCPSSYSFCIFSGSLSGNMAFIAFSLPSFIAVS